MDHDWFYLFGMLEIIGNLFWILSRRLEIYGKSMFYISNVQKNINTEFLVFLQKRRAPKFYAFWCAACPEISHMRPI